jgi:adenosylcobinamide-GDP ribazoletransferase
MCKKRFGGVTGDTAGYYVVMSELVVVVILAVTGTASWM